MNYKQATGRGEGASLVAALPREGNRAAETGQPQEKEADMDDRPIRVLLVEDDEDDYVLTQKFLAEIEGAKFQLDWVETYEAGVQAIRRAEHDVYLLDYRLDGRTGLELLMQMTAEGSRPLVILLTGQGDQQVDVTAMRGSSRLPHQGAD